MATIEQSVDINCPVTTVYNQWTQFEEFPRFMEGVREVTQLDDTHLRWRAEIAGKEETWTAEIDEQLPDQRIAWHSTSGARNAGVITFHRVADDRTRVMAQFEYEPEGMLEKTGSAVGLASSRVKGDLKRFKEFIEQRGRETGEWRGTV
ncbi:MAG: SRPBCC family protein [Burkholderiales bacterium]